MVRNEGPPYEIAIRSALGCQGIRLVGQLFTESVLLALAGGGLGFLLAGALLRTLIGFAPADLPRIADVHLDVRVVILDILDIRNLCDQQCTVRSAAGISFNARASC